MEREIGKGYKIKLYSEMTSTIHSVEMIVGKEIVVEVVTGQEK